MALDFGTVRLPISSDGLLLAATALAQLGLEDADWQALSREHNLRSPARDFGLGDEPTLSLGEFVRLAFALDTAGARRWRRRAQDLMVRAMRGDVRLAAQIAERNPSVQERRWLSARLESTAARRELLATVARHGGQGQIFGQLGSLNNLAVLGKSSDQLREERGVKNTRDGLTSEELLRMAYLDTATARAISEQGAQGNAEILSLHRRTLAQEGQVWGLPQSG